jgi:cytosine/adenosine deaminase-related metal-dependent hydrolase
MRRLSANYILPVSSSPLKNGIVEIDDEGVIQNIIDTKGELQESRNLEFYNGVIVPGFVNTHCHLELSYLKNKVEPKVGLPSFLTNVVQRRKEVENNLIHEGIVNYDAIMRHNGIVAVGDISNTANTLISKKNSKIYYHTFIELLGLGDDSKDAFRKQLIVYNEFVRNGLIVSITPHAPYSVSKDLFLRIKEFSEQNRNLISIHNQESKDENDMFLSKSGGIVEAFNSLGIDLHSWKITGRKSVASIINWLPQKNNILFVHNTYSTKEDIDLIRKNVSNPYWCLCPLSNLYIEDKLPDFALFQMFKNQVTIGTDSLASNHNLSILEEMKTIAFNSSVEFNQLLQWATLNGAKFLKIDQRFGSIEKGKNPGLNLISNFDFKQMNLKESSEIKVLS